MPSVLARLSDSLRAAFLTPLQLQPKSLRDPSLAALWNGTTTDTGVTVTETSALRYPAVWAAVQCIAGDVASLPFTHYKKFPDGSREKYATSRLHRVLHDEMNPEMTALVGRETMTAHVLLWGNAYAEIVRNDLGQVVALWPIEPNRVAPDRDATGQIMYRVQAGDGREVIVPAARMLHLVGLGFNGLMGYSVIGMQRESLGVGIAAERLGGQVMSRGAKYSGFFEHPRTLGATAHKNLKESMTADLPGTYRILEEGMTYKPGSMPLRDAEFMEIRKFQVTEVARIFGIPPHKLGDLERATFSNIESQQTDYLNMTLRRWLKRWEAECNRKLIPPLEKGLQYTEHLTADILRGEINSRYDAYTKGVNNGYLSPNDIRALENLNPIPGGDTYLVQGAMVPLDRLDDLIDARIERATQTDTLTPMGATEPTPDPTPEAAPGRALPAAPEPAQLEASVSRGKNSPDPETFHTDTPTVDVVRTVMETLVAELRAESRATGVGLVAARLVRRELAQLRKRMADPTAAVMRLEKFYRRFVIEGAAELTPWMPNPDLRAGVLTRWADAAMRSCVAAVQMDGGLATLSRAWERDREADLRAMLLEVTSAES